MVSANLGNSGVITTYHPCGTQILFAGLACIQTINRSVDTWGYGSAITALPDIDGDAVEDIAVSAPDGARPIIDIISGASLERIRELSLPDGVASTTRLGRSLVSLSSPGSKKKYLAAGCPNDTMKGGQAVVYNLDSSDTIVLSGGSVQGAFGESMIVVSDINADGCDDLVIGAPAISERNESRVKGSISAYCGRTFQLLWVESPEGAGPFFGEQMAVCQLGCCIGAQQLFVSERGWLGLTELGRSTPPEMRYKWGDDPQRNWRDYTEVVSAGRIVVYSNLAERVVGCTLTPQRQHERLSGAVSISRSPFNDDQHLVVSTAVVALERSYQTSEEYAMAWEGRELCPWTDEETMLLYEKWHVKYVDDVDPMWTKSDDLSVTRIREGSDNDGDGLPELVIGVSRGRDSWNNNKGVAKLVNLRKGAKSSNIGSPLSVATRGQETPHTYAYRVGHSILCPKGRLSSGRSVVLVGAPAWSLSSGMVIIWEPVSRSPVGLLSGNTRTVAWND